VPAVGWESEISQVSATEADAFHKKYYVPSNLVIAVVGDVKAADAMPMLTKYFGAIPAGPRPEPMTTLPNRLTVRNFAPACKWEFASWNSRGPWRSGFGN